MKILLTHEVFMPEYCGGGELVVFEIARRLVERGVDVKLLTTGNPKIKEYKGIQTIRLPINRYLMNLAVPWVYKHGKDCDLIQTNNYNACFPSYVAAKWLRKPVVCLIHGMYADKWVDMRGVVLGNISKWMEKFQIVHNYDRIIFSSDYAKKVGLEIGIPEKITEVINFGIDYKKYRAGKKEPYVLFVGRLARQKGLDFLIEVVKNLPDIRFKLVGSGEQEKRLKSIAPKNVEFLGHKSSKELVDLYSHASIFCLPSVAEAFGLVLLEAMASGCAIVSTTPLGYNGFTVKYGDYKGLKNALRYLIDNPKKALKMGRMNRKMVKKYTWDNFVDRLLKVYEDVLD